MYKHCIPFLSTLLLLSLFACERKDDDTCLMTAEIQIENVNVNQKKLTVVVTGGGIEPYEYLWLTGPPATSQSIDVFRSLDPQAPKLYKVEVTDFAGCSLTLSKTVAFDTVGQCPFLVEIVVTGTGSQKTLAAKSDFGFFPYSFLWSTGETDSTINVVNPNGIFSVTVTDFTACTSVGEKNVSPCPLTVKDDRDSLYNVVSIGGQCWTAENVKSVPFDVTIVIDDNEWRDMQSPAACHYQNDNAFGKTYGLLFNGYALEGTGHLSLCPEGWHIPTDAEWQTLIDFLGGDLVAGKALKADSDLWLLSNEESNTSGFSALPGGRRQADGSFIYEGSQAHFWSTTETQPGSGRLFYRGMASGIQNTIRIDWGRVHGFSCRCIKD